MHELCDELHHHLAFGYAPHVALVLPVLEAAAALGLELPLAVFHLGAQREEHLHVQRQVCVHTGRPRDNPGLYESTFCPSGIEPLRIRSS